MPRSHAGVEKNQTSFVYFPFSPFWGDGICGVVIEKKGRKVMKRVVIACLLTYHAPCWIVRLPQHIVGLRSLPPLRLLCPTFLSLWMVDGSKVTFLASKFLSLSSSPPVIWSPTNSLAVRNASFVRECSLSIFPPVSLLRHGMVGTVADNGAPRFLSDFRSSGVCWTHPFRFLTVLLLGSVHPFRALCVVFVALRCHLQYWLGFYLN